ncbi:hypothetical protein HK104_009221 [Borealophlyctis nickersoniae]|nr:hypothetical protein HK104_009221 [Borealophlyctis nickersoniae]
MFHPTLLALLTLLALNVLRVDAQNDRRITAPATTIVSTTTEFALTREPPVTITAPATTIVSTVTTTDFALTREPPVTITAPATTIVSTTTEVHEIPITITAPPTTITEVQEIPVPVTVSRKTKTVFAPALTSRNLAPHHHRHGPPNRRRCTKWLHDGQHHHQHRDPILRNDNDPRSAPALPVPNLLPNAWMALRNPQELLRVLRR